MKVGILSMQRIRNYGSFLQAYALKKILEEMCCDVQFVDYHKGPCLIHSSEGQGIRRKLNKGMAALRSPGPLRDKIRYARHKQHFADRHDPFLEITDVCNYSPELDVLVIGSDEVFNCVQANTNVGYSPELFGAGNHAGKVISYAASFGNTSIEKLKQYQIEDEIRECLIKFDAISVRDTNSGRIIEELTGKKPEYHLDPVLMYDFCGKCDRIPQNVPESNYLLLYGYNGRFTQEECTVIRNYADNHNLKVICIGGVQGVCDHFVDCNAFEVIAYFKHAAAVVTDTFHGTILSVITQKQFVSIVREGGYGNSEKLTDLLMRLGLTGRAMENDCPGNLEGLMAEPVAYDAVYAIIEREKKHTEQYFTEQIFGEKRFREGKE